MAEGRGTIADIWWFLFTKDAAGRSLIREFFRAKVYRSKHFAHDSFGRHWYRLIGCKYFGHNDVGVLRNDNEDTVYCFACDKELWK
mgnify:CR=1 FL=1|tara:strand:+ start:1339 stop:1596 length:258 start_codon:yes stop_codon:yes gene_type:complete